MRIRSDHFWSTLCLVVSLMVFTVAAIRNDAAAVGIWGLLVLLYLRWWANARQAWVRHQIKPLP